VSYHAAFDADLPVAAGSTDLGGATVHVSCTLSQGLPGSFVDCGNGAATVNAPNGDFYVTLPGGAILTGLVQSPTSVELTTYASYSPSYTSWTGALFVTAIPLAADVHLSFHGTLNVSHYDYHTGQTSDLSVGFSCLVNGPRNSVVVDCTGPQASAQISLDGGVFIVHLQPGAPEMSGTLHENDVEVSYYYSSSPDYIDTLPARQTFSYDAQ
jgi:hypothetical protein